MGVGNFWIQDNVKGLDGAIGKLNFTLESMRMRIPKPEVYRLSLVDHTAILDLHDQTPTSTAQHRRSATPTSCILQEFSILGISVWQYR